MKNPIIERELTGVLRTRKALVLQVGLAVVFALLVLLRWPSDALADLSGSRARQVFELFGYGLLATLALMAPAFPASSIVKEKNRGTLALLLNSPMRPTSIYFGKLVGTLGFVLLLMAMSLPAMAACYAMGGISLVDDVLLLYAVLGLTAAQYTALALAVSCYANSTDSALRITYGLVLLMAVVVLGPHAFLQGKPGLWPYLAEWLRCLSPIPAVMEVLEHGDVGASGLISASGVAVRYAAAASISFLLFAVLSIARLNYRIFDRARPQGKITDDRSLAMRAARRLFFLVDPQRRKGSIGWLTNPVMVKEFRVRRFGRFHWLLRLVAVCAVLSLVLTYLTATGTESWGVEKIGAIMVFLQVGLIVLLTPSLAAGLISSERESGGWDLLRMTRLSLRTILVGKLFSVLWPLALILLATLPGYVVMGAIEPDNWPRISRVLVCLSLTAVFSLSLSAAISSLCRRTAVATAISYALLAGLTVGTMLIWLARGAPFGHATVEAALLVNPMAAALAVIEMPGFAEYNLLPMNWHLVGSASVVCLVVLAVRTWRLTKPL